jgi:hypothetical protein
VVQVLSRVTEGGPPPLDLWTNVRLFDLEDAEMELMDTVGAQQLDVPDVEARFAVGAFDRDKVYEFLMNAITYLHQRGAAVVEDGDTINAGPGDQVWVAQRSDEGTVDVPPRPVLRFMPKD